MDPRYNAYYSGEKYDHHRYHSRSSRPRSRGHSNSSISSLSDDYEYRGSRVLRHSPHHKSCDVIRCQTPPPLVKRIVERVPTPEPEILERIVVRPAPQTIVERVIERPRTPPPRIVHREVTESPQPTIVRTRVVKVNSRMDCCPSRCYSPIPRSSYDPYTYWDDMNPRVSRLSRSHSRRSSYHSRGSRSSSRSSSVHSYYSRPHSRISRSHSFDIINVPPSNSMHQYPFQYLQNGAPNFVTPNPMPMQFGYPTNNIIGPSPQTMQNAFQMNVHRPPIIMNQIPQSGFISNPGTPPGSPIPFTQQFGMLSLNQQPKPVFVRPQQVINLPPVHLQPNQMPPNFFAYRPMPSAF